MKTIYTFFVCTLLGLALSAQTNNTANKYYTWKGKNVVGIGGFKSYFGLWFFDGASLEDDKGVLINAQPGKTKSLRQWRMTSAKEIKPAAIKRYVKEAMDLQAEENSCDS